MVKSKSKKSVARKSEAPYCGQKDRAAHVQLITMDKLLFWLGLGAAQKGAGSEEVKRSRHPFISFVVGVLIALLLAAGAFFLLVSQQ